MNAKVVINDISKLRPELTNLSLAEIERRRAELDMAEAVIRETEGAKAREEMEKKLAAARQEHDGHVERALENAVDGIQKLYRYGLLKDETVAAATDSRGVFVAINLFRRKLPADWIPPGFSPDGSAPARSAKASAKPKQDTPLSTKGEKAVDVIEAYIKKVGSVPTRDAVFRHLSKDAGFAKGLETFEKHFIGAVASLVRMGRIKKDGNGYKAP